MSKFYFTQLASRPMVLSGKTFRFLICSVMSGRSVGIYEATDPEEINVLDDAVRGKRGIREIGEEEAGLLKKKATRTLQSPKSAGFRPRLARPPELPALAVAERAGVTSAATRNAVEETALLSKPEPKSLINIARVNSPKPFSGSENRVEKAVKRADRAKIRVARPAVDSSSPTTD